MNDIRLRDWLLGSVFGGALGFGIGYLLKKPIRKIRMRYGIDEEHNLHHSQIGFSVMGLGTLTAINKYRYAPVLIGVGAGLVAEDYLSHLGLNPIDTPYEVYEVGGSIAEESSDHEQRITWKKVPNFPENARISAMVDIIREIIYEDANHPYVRKKMGEIIRQYGLDGRDTLSILSVLQTWFHENLIYVHDPSRGKFGEPTDRYAHAYITLPPDEDNPKGTGMGDCDDFVIAYCAMALSVGLPNIIAVLVDQGKGYSHIGAGYSKVDGIPRGIDDVIYIELTEPKPFGWVPNAKRFGFVML